MKTTLLKLFLLAALAFGALRPAAQAAPVNWTGLAGNNQWNDGNNWNTTVVPGPADDAIFNSGAGNGPWDITGAPLAATSLNFNAPGAGVFLVGSFFGQNTLTLPTAGLIDNSSSLVTFLHADLICGSVGSTLATLTLNGSGPGKTFLVGRFLSQPNLVVNGGQFAISPPWAVPFTLNSLTVNNNGWIEIGISNVVNVLNPVVINPGGTLRLCNPGNIPAGIFTAPSFVLSGTLQANGTITSGNVNVAANGILSGGCSPGTFTLNGNLNLDPAATMVAELDMPNIVGGGVNDLIVVNGNLALGGNLVVVPGLNFADGVYRLVNYTGTLTYSALNIASAPAGKMYTVSTNTQGQVNLIVAPDITPPTLVSATASCQSNRLLVVFSEPLDPTSAVDEFSYAISGGISIQDIALAADGRTVILGTTPLTPSANYTLAVENVTDLAGNAIAPGSSINFACATADCPCPTNNLIVNGSFEDNPFINAGDGCEYLPVTSTIAPWTVTIDEILRCQNGAYNLTASHGTKFLDLSGASDAAPHGGVTQTVPTTPGQCYRLTFDLGVNLDNPRLIGPITVRATAGAITQSFTHNPSGSGTVWSNYGFLFAATSTSTPITIEGASGDAFIGLDNVALVCSCDCPSGAPVITMQPQSLTVTQGQNATFTVSATGTAPLQYQWIFCPQPFWNLPTNLLPVTSATLTLSNVQPVNAGDYLALVSNASGSVTSAVARLTVVPDTKCLIFAGREHCPAGAAGLNTNSNSLFISNLGSSGQDGVRIHLNRAVSSDIFWLPLDPSASSPLGSWLQLDFTGSILGVTNRSLGYVRVTHDGTNADGFQIMADLTPLGSPTERVEVWSQGTRLGVFPGQPTGIVARASFWPRGGGKLGLGEGGYLLGCISLGWPFPTRIWVNGTQFVADELRVLQESAPVVNYLSAATITAIGIPELIITNERVTLTVGAYHNSALDYLRAQGLFMTNVVRVTSNDVARLANGAGEYLVSVGFSSAEAAAAVSGVLQRLTQANAFYVDSGVAYFGFPVPTDQAGSYLTARLQAVGLVSPAFIEQVNAVINMIVANATPTEVLTYLRSTFVEALTNPADKSAAFVFIDIFTASLLYWTHPTNGSPANRCSFCGALWDGVGGLLLIETGPGSIVGGALMSAAYEAGQDRAGSAIARPLSDVEYGGLNHIALGTAGLDVQQNRVVVYPREAGTSFGVGVYLNRAVSYDAFWLPLDSSASSPLGSWVQVDFTGSVLGVTNHSLGSARVTHVSNNSNGYSVSADLTPINSPTVRLEVWGHGELLAVFPGQPAGVIAQASIWPTGGGKSGRSFPPFILGCLSFCYPLGTDIWVNGNHFMADQLLMLQESAPSINYLSGISISAANIQEIDITRESVVPLRPTLTITRSGGSITIQWSGDGVLQESSNLVAWTDLIGATSPYSTPASTATKFYRVRQP